MLDHYSREPALPNKRKVKLQRFNVGQLRDQHSSKGMESAIVKSINSLFSISKLCLFDNVNGLSSDVLEIR